MPENDTPIERAKREAFGAKAHQAFVEQVGSGISETTRISLIILHDLERLKHMPAPWTENRDMIVALFTPIFERSWQCPGRDHARCCHAEGDQACFPKWREREDPEWYAQAINILLSQVNVRITQEGPLVPALAADEGFELGCLLTEALIKFRWDEHAKRGAKVAGGSQLGGEMRREANRARLTRAGTVEAVDALLAVGMRPMQAYRRVASDQGVGEQTIRKEYTATKKVR